MPITSSTSIYKFHDFITFKKYTMHKNSAWITIKDEDGNIVWQREPQNDNWYDEHHANMMKAFQTIESIITEITNK